MQICGTPQSCKLIVAREPGLEPGKTGLETAVIPFHHSRIDSNSTVFTYLLQIISSKFLHFDF